MKYTIIIDKTKEEPIDPEGPGLDGVTVVYFESKQAVCDNADVSTLFDKGNMSSSTDKGSVKYLGAEFGECVKFESSTSGTVKTPSSCFVTVVFGSKKDAPKIWINDDKISLVNSGNGAWTYTFTATAGGEYIVKKGNSWGTSDTFLYAVVYEPIPTAVESIVASQSADKTSVTKKISDAQLIIEANGKQFNAAGAQVK